MAGFGRGKFLSGSQVGADTQVELAFYYNKWWSFDGNAKTGKYNVTKELKGSPDWQTVSVGVDELQPQAAGLPSPIPNNWQYIADVNVKAWVDGIRKIYWAKATGKSSSPNLPAATSVPATTTTRMRVNGEGSRKSPCNHVGMARWKNARKGPGRGGKGTAGERRQRTSNYRR